MLDYVDALDLKMEVEAEIKALFAEVAAEYMKPLIQGQLALRVLAMSPEMLAQMEAERPGSLDAIDKVLGGKLGGRRYG